MQYQVSGTVMQTLAIHLLPDEIVYSQTNCMCWMNDAIEMNTNTGGGFLAGVGRMFGGGSLFITDFTARGNGHVAFPPRFPGTIRAELPLSPGWRRSWSRDFPDGRPIQPRRGRPDCPAAHHSPAGRSTMAE
jgi:Mitochondrial biogenesis AIM24